MGQIADLDANSSLPIEGEQAAISSHDKHAFVQGVKFEATQTFGH
jgi:hypothetical protein